MNEAGLDMRETIRGEVLAIRPLDSLEKAHQEDALKWIDSGAELCRLAKPATPPKHLVAYFAVVADEHILLVDHRLAQLWLPTGGHVEPREHPRATVLRELHEELGLAPATEIGAPVMITCTTTVGLTAGHTDVSLWYVVKARRDPSMQYDTREFADARWFRWDEVPLSRSDPHMERFLNKLRHSSSSTSSMSSSVTPNCASSA